MATTAPEQPQAPAQAYAQFPNAYGQPFQTYSQYGQPAGAPQPTQHVIRPELVEAKSWKIARSALHGIGIIVSIVCIGLSFSFRRTWTEIYVTWCSTPPAFAGLIWSTAELIVRAVKKQKQGIHPGAHVGMCLIIWLAASLVAGIFSATAAITGYDSSYSSRCSSSSSNYSSSYYYNYCDTPFSTRYAQFLALSIFTWLLWLVYFILFVGSCVDTHKYNQHRRQPVMVVGPGAFWSGQGWQQLPPGAQVMPTPAAARDIPLQERNSTQPEGQMPMEFYNEKGKEPQRVAPSHPPAAPQITEYYTPEGR